jgi:hypothetical protein
MKESFAVIPMPEQPGKSPAHRSVIYCKYFKASGLSLSITSPFQTESAPARRVAGLAGSPGCQ